MSIGLGIGVQRPKQLRSIYSVNGKVPGFTADFIKNRYPGYTSLSSAITHARAGNATMTDGYGPELVTNGGFASDSDWTLTSNASILDGKLKIQVSSGGFERANQTFSYVEGRTYIATIELNGTSGSEFRFRDAADDTGGLTTSASRTTMDGNPQFLEFVFQANSNSTGFYIERQTGSGDYVATIDNVSVREMPVIKWGPHNLLTYSEEFDNAAWTKNTSATVTANQIVAPDGTTTADEINFPTAGSSNIQQTVSGLNTTNTYVFAVWLKVASGTMDVNIGNVNAGVYSSVTITDDWQLFTVEQTPSATSRFPRIIPTSGVTGTFYAWGAHFYRSDLGGMVDNPDRGDSYVPTTSAAKYLPRIGHHVYNGSAWANEGVLAESESRTNDVPYSNDFTQSWWSVTSSTKTMNAVGPDGQENSACTLNDSSGGGTGTVRTFASSLTVSTSSEYTWSVYAKADQLDQMSLFTSNFTTPSNGNTFFDLSNGTIGAVHSAHTATMQDVGNGWYRCAITFTTDATDTSGNVSIYVASGGSTTVDLDGTSSILIYGAQFEEGSTPSSLIPTSGSSVSRAAETFTIPSANLPWPEPQYIGSELVTNGTFDTDSDWTKGSSATISGGKLNYSSGTSGDTYQNIGLTSGPVYAISFEISNHVSGSVRLRGGLTTVGTSRTGNGSFVEYLKLDGTNANLIIDASSDFEGSIDNVSVREINPLAVCIGMEGRVTYADEGTTQTSKFYRWINGGEYIQPSIFTDSTRTGLMAFEQAVAGVYDAVSSSTTHYSPDVLVPFNVASRHGSTFINGAVEGVALTENTTPTALADLESADLSLAYDYMGTISEFRVWDRDITDDGLVEATNPSLEPSLSLTFEGIGTNSFVVNNWSE